jgi:hypothetical protein
MQGVVCEFPSFSSSVSQKVQMLSRQQFPLLE